MSEYHKIQTLFKRDMSSKLKTLLENQWTLPEFEYLARNNWVFTEKVDGTNIRVSWREDGGVLIQGRTNNAQLPAPLVETIMRKLGDAGSSMPPGIVLYGEGYGGKIQSGGKYRQDQSFVLFDANVNGWWLKRDAVEDIAAKLAIDVVPVIGSGTLHDAVAMARTGIRSTWGDFEAEGIVARPAVELKTRSGDRLIAKIKCRDFRSAE